LTERVESPRTSAMSSDDDTKDIKNIYVDKWDRHGISCTKKVSGINSDAIVIREYNAIKDDDWNVQFFLVKESCKEGDGRTLFCGLDSSLKVYSWEPVVCHDALDMGWSTLGDLCIDDGKLLGCSYYQNSVAVWVADTTNGIDMESRVPKKSAELIGSSGINML
nr:katanin p80 WD40 repeat-containing subunit B1 homolog isoform X2 [Tanacetum cinerariifolium]